MIPATTAAAYSISAYLQSAELAGSSGATSRDQVAVEKSFDRTFYRGWSWAELLGRDRQGVQQVTANSEPVPVLADVDRSEDAVAATILELGRLTAGWDGERASKPNATSIHDAVRFVNAVGVLSAKLEPTLHVDGTIILELDSGADGSLRFLGHDKISYALGTHGCGTFEFDGFGLPKEIALALAEAAAVE